MSVAPPCPSSRLVERGTPADPRGGRSERDPMVHLLVLAQDECVRLTCAEVLTRLGVDATAGAWPPAAGGVKPEAILAWEASEGDVAAIRALHGEVPLFVCTWRHRERWPASVDVVRLPFNAARVVRAVEQAVQEARQTADAGRVQRLGGSAVGGSAAT